MGKTHLDDYLLEAVEKKATDVHIMTGAYPRYRLYGDLTNFSRESPLDSQAVKDLLEPLLDALARKELDAKGQWDMSYRINTGVRFRVNIFKQKQNALSGVFRVLPEEIPSFEDLGLPNYVLHTMTNRQGLFLVTGATGSGKTTTLAVLLDYINANQPKHIIMLEQPIEYLHWHKQSNISQREVGLDVVNFYEGLKSALRQDPDVILVGEMRDRETMEVALQASETGHLVFSTLHTNGAVESIQRLVDGFPIERERQLYHQLSMNLQGILSQKLVKRKDKTGFVCIYELLLLDEVGRGLIYNGDIRKLKGYMESPEGVALGCKSMKICEREYRECGVI